ncbi:MAG: PhzF family phenazine biosynthesis protein, partial [Pseudomonadota bacterium]
MAREFRTLDVFTTETFGGNPLAVVMDGQGLSTDDMQTIAAEFNLSETTFILPPDDPANAANVRIFTPKSELPFAGHPTVGTAIVLAGEMHGDAYETELRLEEKVGLVKVEVSKAAGEPAYAQFSAAVMPEVGDGEPSAAAAAAAIGLLPEDIGFAGHEVGAVSAGNGFVFIPAANREALARAWPDMTAWRAAGFPEGMVGVFAYTQGGESADAHWRGRMFGPDQGIMEDPAT